MTVVPLDLITVQVKTWPRTAFILGLSQLGDALGGTASDWVDILGDATKLTFVRGGKVSGATNALDVGRLAITLRNAQDPQTGPYWMIPNLPIRILQDTEVLFTGRLEAARATYDVDNTWVTLTATDAIKELANVKAAPTIVYAETFPERVDALMAHTAVGYDPLPDWHGTTLDRAVAGWTSTADFGSWGPAGISVGLAHVGSPSPVKLIGPAVLGSADVAPFESGLTYLLAGLTVGTAYTVALRVSYTWSTGYEIEFEEAFRTYALGVDIDGRTYWGNPTIADVAAAVAAPAIANAARITFTATATSHTLRVAKDYTATLGDAANNPDQWLYHNLSVGPMTVYRHTLDGLKPLDGLALEDTLATHLDIACNSAGVDWWVGQDNRVKFRLHADGDTPTMILSDVLNPAHVNYLDIVAAFDSLDAVNTLEMDNHSIGKDGTDATRIWTSTDADSVALYGVRSGALAVNLPTPYLEARALEAMNPAPSFVVESVDVDVLKYPAVAALELFTDVQVLFRTYTGTYQVVGIQHTVSPTTWKATLSLRKETA